MEKFRIVLILIVVHVLQACQPEASTSVYKTEMKIMDLERSVLKGDYYNSKILAGEIKLLLADQKLLSDKTADLPRIMDEVIEGEYSTRNGNIISQIKETYLEEYYDAAVKSPYLPALWKMGNDLHMNVLTATDPMLNLYEWNEFQAQVAELRSSWDNFLRYDPGLELLQFDQSKLQEYPKYFAILKKAVDNYISMIADEQKNLYEICTAAENMERAYIDLLTFIIYRPEESGNEDELLF